MGSSNSLAAKMVLARRKVTTCALLLPGVLLLATASWAETPLASLRGSTILRKVDSPYRVVGHLILGINDSLTIEPGVVVRVESYAKILLRGAVSIRGTSADPVHFGPSNAEDGWIGLHFASTHKVQAEHFVVENAFRNTVTSSVGTLRHCRFTGNYYGLWVENSDRFALEDCEFTGNRYGLSLIAGTMQISRSRISENAFGVYQEAGAKITASQSRIEGNLVQDFQDESVEVGLLPKKVLRRLEARF